LLEKAIKITAWNCEYVYVRERAGEGRGSLSEKMKGKHVRYIVR